MGNDTNFNNVIKSGSGLRMFSLKNLLALTCLFALIFACLYLRIELIRQKQMTKAIFEAFGSISSDSEFDIACLGDTIEEDNSTELAGCYLIRTSRLNDVFLKATFFDGKTNRTKTQSFLLDCPQVSLCTSSVKSELNDSRVSRFFTIQSTDARWIGESSAVFSIPYYSHFRCSFKKANGEIDDQVIIAFAFYNGSRPPFDSAAINAGNIDDLEKFAAQWKLSVVCFQLTVQSETGAGPVSRSDKACGQKPQPNVLSGEIKRETVDQHENLSRI